MSTSEKQIEEILYKASKLGIRSEVISLAKNYIESNKYADRVSVYEKAFNKLTN